MSQPSGNDQAPEASRQRPPDEPAQQPPDGPEPVVGSDTGVDIELVDPPGTSSAPAHQLPQVTIPSLRQKRFKASFSGHHAMSWRLFVTVAVLATTMMVLLALFAWLTYPTVGDMAELTAGATVEERVKATIDARSIWTQQFITLSQTLLIGSLVPLLATITAYALGEKAREGRRDES